MMFCRHCGNALEEQSKFCGHCGKSVAAEPAAVPVAPSAAPANAADTETHATYTPQAAPAPQAGSYPTVTAASSPVKKEYRKAMIFGGVAVAIALIIALLQMIGGGGGSQSSPEAAVKGFIKAAGKHDIKAIMKYVPLDERPSGEALDYFKEMIEQQMKESDLKIVKYKILRSEISGNRASVDYMIQTKEDGEKNDPQEDSFDLIKVGDKWYIEDLGFDLDSDF